MLRRNTALRLYALFSRLLSSPFTARSLEVMTTPKTKIVVRKRSTLTVHLDLVPFPIWFCSTFSNYAWWENPRRCPLGRTKRSSLVRELISCRKTLVDLSTLSLREAFLEDHLSFQAMTSIITSPHTLSFGNEMRYRWKKVYEAERYWGKNSAFRQEYPL